LPRFYIQFATEEFKTKPTFVQLTNTLSDYGRFLSNIEFVPFRFDRTVVYKKGLSPLKLGPSTTEYRKGRRYSTYLTYAYIIPYANLRISVLPGVVLEYPLMSIYSIKRDGAAIASQGIKINALSKLALDINTTKIVDGGYDEFDVGYRFMYDSYEIDDRTSRFLGAGMFMDINLLPPKSGSERLSIYAAYVYLWELKGDLRSGVVSLGLKAKL
jgi:hypothetical protein